MQEKIPHIPVLYKEVLQSFEDIEEGTFIDCTMGYAGHSELLLKAHEKRELIGIDQDKTAIEFSKRRLAPFGERVRIEQGRFSDVVASLFKEGVKPAALLADIGVSSLQLDEHERGFSYESDTLDMRMNPQQELSATDVVNSYGEHELERILKEYGELKNARKVASFIVANRPFHSAKELSEAVRPLMPKGKKIHPSTLLFQAIRIEVNDELGELERLLDAIEASEVKRMRVAIISFHSLEDRIVKRRFAKWAKSCICPSDAIRCSCGNNHAIGKVLTKKPLVASKEELEANPRSRSAKLRVFQIER